MILVLRTRCNHLRVGDRWFNLHTLRDCLREHLIAAGSRNPAFDMPPAFRTFSTWGSVLLSLGAPEVSEPPDYFIEVVPDLPEPWRGAEPLWKRLWPEMAA